MIRFFTFLLPLILGFCAGCDNQPAPDRGEIRIETDPAGAILSCNGGPEKNSPTVFQGLSAGVYMITATKTGYRDIRQTVALMPGQKTSIRLPLEPLLGLVLVQSAPVGADITMDGAFRGKAPLLIPDFPLGTHRLRLSLPGFESKEIELTVKDRTPIRQIVDLASKTARLDITSDPSGAAVYIDNAPRGATPCEVETTADTNSLIEIKLDGYTPYSETLTLQSGGRYPVKARLMPLPADLEVTSTPSGARVFIDGEFRGVTPLTITGLARGDHKLKIDNKGFEIIERPITISSAGKIREDAALVRNSGTLVLITQPPGVEVFVDGEAHGTTAVSESGGAASDPLRIDLLSQGEHTLQLTRRGYSFKPKKFAVQTGQVVQLQESLTRLFIRDTAVTVRKDGGRYEVTGQLLRKLPNGDIEIEVNPGIIQKLDAASVSEVRPLKQDTP